MSLAKPLSSKLQSQPQLQQASASPIKSTKQRQFLFNKVISEERNKNVNDRMEMLRFKNGPMTAFGRHVSWSQVVTDVDFGHNPKRLDYALFEKMMTSFDHQAKKAIELRDVRNNLKKELPSSVFFRKSEYLDLRENDDSKDNLAATRMLLAMPITKIAERALLASGRRKSIAMGTPLAMSSSSSLMKSRKLGLNLGDKPVSLFGQLLNQHNLRPRCVSEQLSTKHYDPPLGPM